MKTLIDVNERIRVERNVDCVIFKITETSDTKVPKDRSIMNSQQLDRIPGDFERFSSQEIFKIGVFKNYFRSPLQL